MPKYYALRGVPASVLPTNEIGQAAKWTIGLTDGLLENILL